MKTHQKKILKGLVYFSIVIYWFIEMDQGIKGEGILGSLLGILCLGFFIYFLTQMFWGDFFKKK